MRTAAKWKVLEGHEQPITTMNFDDSGTYLASYSVQDLSLRIWKIGTAGFFGGILGMNGRHLKMLKVEGGEGGEGAKWKIVWDKQKAVLWRDEKKAGEIEA